MNNTNISLLQFRKNIKTARRSKNLSQENLSKLLKINKQNISNWETGKNTPSIETLLYLLPILGLDTPDIFKKDLAKEGETPPNNQTSMMSKSSYEILLEDAIKKECPELAKRLNL